MTILEERMAAHRCDSCSGTEDRFCSGCGYHIDAHPSRDDDPFAIRCPESEAEAVAEWGRP